MNRRSGAGEYLRRIHLSYEVLIPVYAGVAEAPKAAPKTDPVPYVLSFPSSQRARCDNGFRTVIPKKAPRNMMPSVVQVHRNDSMGSREAMVSKTISSDGDVIMESLEAFGGFVSILRGCDIRPISNPYLNDGII